MIERLVFDVIISDYQMPGMSGLDLLKALKAGHNDVPFILFTGKGREEVAMEAINNGADFYLQKGGNPIVQFQELKNAIVKLTQKRAAETALREREEKLRLITDNMTDIIFEMDQGGTIRYVSPSVKIILGYEPEKIIGLNGLLGVHPEDKDLIRDKFLSLLKGTAPVKEKLVFRYRTTNGGYLWLETIGSVLRGADGRPKGFLLSSRDVTGRIEAELARKSSERKYRDIIDNANDEILIVDLKGRVLEANKVASQRLGYVHEEIVGMNIVVIDPHCMEKERQKMVSGTMEDKADIVETTHIARDGTEIPVEVSRTIIDLDGRPGILMIARDVSDRKEAERRVRDSERLLNQTQRAAHIGGYHIDLVNGTSSWTEEAYHLCGLDPLKDGPCNEDYLKLGLPQDRELFEQAWWEMTEQNTEFDFVYHLLLPRTGVRHLRNRGRLELDDHGNIVGILGTIMDITDLQRTENRLMENQRLLGEAERVSHTASFHVDWARKELHFSDEVFNILEMEHDREICFKDIADLVHPDDRAYFMETIERMKKGVKDVDVTFRIVRKDGTMVNIIGRARTEVGPHGEVKGVFGSVMDVTERVRAEQAARLAELKIALLGNITRYEINNKVKVLNGFIQMAVNRSRDPVIKELMAKARTATRCINNKLTFNEDYLSLGQAEPLWMDLDEVCDKAVSKLELGPVALYMNVNDYEVLADPMLEKVFQNLVENSLLHGVTLDKISISSRVTLSGLVVTIEDNGQGIADEDRGKLFDWEFRGRHGHGMHLISEVLRSSGMSIKETGTKGKGARFEILVPPNMYRTKLHSPVGGPPRVSVIT